MRLPWERENDKEFAKEEKLRKSNTELAEKLTPEPEKRLRNVALRMVERMKVGAVGATQALVDAIHMKWEEEEVVKLKFEGPPSKNMKRTHEIIKNLFEEELMDLSELNLLLDKLDPRFIDWSGPEPLPVDADLLPAVVPGYRPPLDFFLMGLDKHYGTKK
ncbi:CRS1/YhbY (CRM) domain-containing protein [Abeliophyllum distichum]|uniref:CRS1/YhbY (CRM) domain-containing protein n=1 Tax=Abeliophyllum distichum TaxID=126358 RepID=A0ABD1QW82_9LAMI